MRMKEELSGGGVMSLCGHLSQEEIGNEIVLIDDIRFFTLFDYPVKSDVVIAMLCLKGNITGSVNMKEYTFSANSFFVIDKGQIFQCHQVSEDFSAIIILMSMRFVESLAVSAESVSIFIHLKDNPMLLMNQEELDFLMDSFSFIRKVFRMVDNPHRMEMIKLLAKTFFYGANSFHRYKKQEKARESKERVHFEAFYNAVLNYYKESREVTFYADKLCLNPKYLSTIIRKVSGRPASKWINDYVILEAMAMLKYTGSSVQEISNNLGFPNQSFFGKFFKQHTGLSPKEYRRK